jgi:hypothetical protein
VACCAGLFVAVGLGSVLVTTTLQKRMRVLGLKSETERLIVEDLSQRQHLIERF